jgi:hypothetical protein
MQSMQTWAAQAMNNGQANNQAHARRQVFPLSFHALGGAGASTRTRPSHGQSAPALLVKDGTNNYMCRVETTTTWNPLGGTGASTKTRPSHSHGQSVLLCLACPRKFDPCCETLKIQWHSIPLLSTSTSTRTQRNNTIQ